MQLISIFIIDFFLMRNEIIWILLKFFEKPQNM